MDFKDLLLYEYKFWESVQVEDSFSLVEDGFFTRRKQDSHYLNHCFGDRPGNYDASRKYRGTDGKERYVYPPSVTLYQYVKMANDLMNNKNGSEVDGWIDNYFTRVLPNRPLYIKIRKSDVTIEKYHKTFNPYYDYVVYQINDNKERKILSFGLTSLSDYAWRAIISYDEPLQPLPESELIPSKKEEEEPEEIKEPEKEPEATVYYIDTKDHKLKSMIMSRYDAQRDYSWQWNNIDNTDTLIYKIVDNDTNKDVISYPPNNFHKKNFWVDQENIHNVDLSGDVTNKVIKVFEKNNQQYNDDILDKFIKVYKMKKLRNATEEKIASNFDVVMLVVGDYNQENIDIIQDDIKEHYFKLQEGYLAEANRQQLLQKSRNAKHYKDISKGKNRYERRMKSKISATVRDYNNIQMDQFFKRDILEIKIPVMGETDVYQVDIKINGVLKEIQNQIHTNKGELEFKVILQSLMKVLNIGDVYIGCDCPDARYRMAYNQTKNGYKAGYRETRPSNITNPRDDLGSGCKHTMLVLANLDWCVKVASVINNYIKYCQEHLKQAYADYIFPKVYGTKYDKAIQMNLFYNGMLPEDRKLMDEITSKSLQGRDAQGKFKKENPYTFQKKDLNEPNDNQLQLNLNEPKEKELKVEN